LQEGSDATQAGAAAPKAVMEDAPAAACPAAAMEVRRRAEVLHGWGARVRKGGGREERGREVEREGEGGSEGGTCFRHRRSCSREWENGEWEMGRERGRDLGFFVL